MNGAVAATNNMRTPSISFIYDDAIVLIEWSKLIEEALPANIIRVVISKDLEKGFDYRKIAVEGIDDEDFGN